MEGKVSKFKGEVCLLLGAILLFVVSAFFFSYQTTGNEFALSASLATYPYRGIALTFVGCGSILTLAASISFLRQERKL